MSPDPQQQLYDGIVVEITRTVPYYAVADGKESMVYLPLGSTVDEVLKKAGIVVREQDEVNYMVYASAIPEEKLWSPGMTRRL